MKYFKQLMIILAISFLGYGLQIIFHLPIPGAVIGMLLLFLLLQTKLIKLEMIEDLCGFLLSNMSFFFIPAGVGLVVSFTSLKDNWIGVLLIIVASTALVWLVTAFTVKLFRRGKPNE
jgi:holin-like protein